MKPKQDAREKGFHYESQVLDFLQQKGLHLLERNYHCRLGEIDLIMEDQDGIVFVEVRYRSRADYGGALESVTWAKQRKLINTAHVFLAHKRLEEKACRFDVVTIDASDAADSLNWIKDAFGA